MRLDESSWRQALAVLQSVDDHTDRPLAVVFVGSDDYAAKRGMAWLWWPANPPRAVQHCDYDGWFAADWGMLLVMSEAALETVCAQGESCLARLVRRGAIMPFLLRERDELEAAGLIDFIETLELATPKH